MLLLEKDTSDDFSPRFIKDFFAPEYKGKKYLFGTNPLAADFSRELKIDGFVTTKSRKKEFLGKALVVIDEVQKDDLVLICETNGAAAVKRLLSSCNFRYMDCFSFSKKTGSSVNIYHFSGWAEDIDKNFDKYQKIFERLTDEESKKVFYNLINFKHSGDMRYLKNFENLEKNQYFEAFLNLPDDAAFADAGGFTGDTSLQFIEKYPDYSAIYLFEPEPHFLKKARENLKGHKNIFFIEKGLSDTKGKTNFSSKGLASSFDKNGEIEIETDSLDSCIAEEGKLDIIKMDIEGEELSALHGAVRTIKRFHPALAICVYHKPEDFWKIPEYVLSIRNDYSLYLRHYSEVSDETVMFFIPDKS